MFSGVSGVVVRGSAICVDGERKKKLRQCHHRLLWVGEKSCLSIDLHIVVHLSIQLISSLGLASITLRATATTATTTATRTATAGAMRTLLSLVLVVGNRSPKNQQSKTTRQRYQSKTPDSGLHVRSC